MKQILIISGKGGTGKTVVSGAFASLADNKVLADCDVDAANLYLLMDPQVRERHDFQAGAVAQLDREACARCGLCRELCRFGAINTEYEIDPVACEGCGLCSHACPAGAIHMQDCVCGEWFVSDTRFGTFVHARLGVAQENSGKLVALVKQQAKTIAQERKHDFVIIDGSPGIGCPVITSLSGVSCAVLVTEPSVSGLHDADRVIEVARHFQVPVKVVVNKYDLNVEIACQMESHWREQGIPVIGKIPFDRSVVEATLQAKTIMESSHEKVKDELKTIWQRVCS